MSAIAQRVASSVKSRRRVLVAQIPMPNNRFLCDLNGELAKYCELHQSCDDFWSMRGGWDVIHFHFPEYMTYRIECAYVEGLTEALIEETETRLRYWADRSRLIVTRHVLLPHDAIRDPMWERMYETVYRYADAVVHFAAASVAEFRDRYRGTVFQRGHEPLHAIIPHQNYASLPNQVPRAEARRRLRIPDNASVLLVFGAIRNDEERQFILDIFRRIRVPRRVLLVSSWREKLAEVSWIRLKYWIRDLARLYHRLHPRHRFHYGFVEESDAQIYLNASDVLLIPRFRVLNSGNVALGMTFGRIVVGPDSWDVGELLRATGNPVFDPDRPEEAFQAVEQAFKLAVEGRVGAENRERSLADWSAGSCACQYSDLYEAVCRQGVSLDPAASATKALALERGKCDAKGILDQG